MNTPSEQENQNFVQWFLKHRHTNDSLDSYHDEAILVNKPGSFVLGKHQIGETLNNDGRHSHVCGDNVVIENGDVALVLSKLYPNQNGKNSANFTEAKRAIHVFKKDSERQLAMCR